MPENDPLPSFGTAAQPAPKGLVEAEPIEVSLEVIELESELVEELLSELIDDELSEGVIEELLEVSLAEPPALLSEEEPQAASPSEVVNTSALAARRVFMA
ncbi:hypothetical protein [Metallococcus carri]|uniref:hypothetical protein n=1 Tax=Metallococcus carri TaxID=1656884 RepID=UPI002E2B960C|nr:hypothetical protein [Metallococcus carri]